MLKLFLCAVIITGSAFIGISLSGNEKRDLKVIRALLLFADHAEKEIRRCRSTFDEILSSYINEEKEAKAFFDILRENKKDRTPRERIAEAVSTLNSDGVLKDTLYEIAGTFEENDADTISGKLRRSIGVLTSEYERLSGEINSKSRLYRSVSAILGIAAAIILY